MAVIFPFEKRFYENAGIKSFYVGHPLIQDNSYQKNYNNEKNFIGFFPGSRFSEVKKHLPIINNVIESMYNENKEHKFLISRSENINKNIYEKYFANKSYVSIMSNENIYETIDLCKVAVAASGTITLQIALKKVPLCVFYKLSSATYFFVKFLVKIKFISLVNIVLEKKVVQEFVQSDASSENIEKEVKRMIDDKKYRENLKKEISLIEEILKDNDSKIDMNKVIRESL